MGILDERMTYTTLTPACAVVAALLDHDVYVFVTGCVFFWGILSFIAIFLVLRSIELREGF